MDTSPIEHQIKAIEEEILNTQKNKATEHHIGKLKAKLARLRDEVEKQKSAGGRGKGFAIKKSGDATVGIIGFPSVGKSTLLNQLTDASSKIAEYDFTTLEVIPGIMKYKGARVQLLDLPGLIRGASKGRGRGREILSAVRSVDLLLLLVDIQRPQHLELIEKELYDAGLRLNQTMPDVVITKKGQGGITVNTAIPLTYLSERIIKAIASEFVINADITVREDITEDQLIDVFFQNRMYPSAMVVLNKTDRVDERQLGARVKNVQEKGWHVVSVSAKTGDNLDQLREEIFSQLQLIRIYMKPIGGDPDYDEPLILKDGATVEDACTRLHRDFQRKFRYALLWGSSAKHAGQRIGLEHILHDNDILTLVTKK